MNKIEHLYLHVPFCEEICAFCDFYRSKYNDELVNQWLEQIAIDCSSIKTGLKTIYIGGGTPSSLSESQLERLLQILKPLSANLEEYSVEANPESLSSEKIKLLKAYGVTRISLGVQTFQPKLQKLLKRSVDCNIKTLIDEIKSNGIQRISIDLMYALPFQTFEDWKSDLQIAAGLDIEHISLYSLTIEEDSLFGRQGVKPRENEFESACYEEAISYLSTQGFQHYEVSSFAKKNEESKHNLAYWNYQDFYGIGPGASGKEGMIRYLNEKRIDLYVQGQRNRENEVLSEEDCIFESFMMGLRKKSGIDLEELKKKYPSFKQEEYQTIITKWSDRFLVQKGTVVFPTEEGLLVLHEILLDFMK